MTLDKVECIRDIINSCLLPELTCNLDTVAIQEKHFTTYHNLLQQQLPLLYDILQQNKEMLADELVSELIVLLCELTAENAEFKLERGNIVENANRMLHRFQSLPKIVEEAIFSYYEEKLHKDRWKRQLGALYGLLRFLQYRYKTSDNKMSTNWLNLCLSVGLNVHEFAVDPKYKHLAVRLFSLILDHSDLEHIQQLNIHSVIYAEVFKDVYNMDSLEFTTDIWQCLLQCLHNFENIDSLTWNQCDDMLERLINNVTFAPNNLISICMMRFITKLGYFFTINRKEFEIKLSADIDRKHISLEDCRVICQSNSSHTSFRWAKSILDMFIIESPKLMSTLDISQKILFEMHKCYLVCILPIPLEVLHPHLATFYDKFTAVLMEFIAINNRDQRVVEMSTQFILTFYWQLQHSVYCEKNTELSMFRVLFEKLLNHINNENDS